jgi:hypothetical protein
MMFITGVNDSGDKLFTDANTSLPRPENEKYAKFQSSSLKWTQLSS